MHLANFVALAAVLFTLKIWNFVLLLRL